MFGFQKKLNSDEYEKLTKRLTEVFSRIEELSAKFEALQTGYNDLRGKFNRKIAGIMREESQDETQTINNPVILPENELFRKFR